MTDRDTAKCACCGGRFHIDDLDAKPDRLAGPGNWLIRNVTPWVRRDALSDAQWAGEDFDRLECEGCYGPGYEKGVRS